MKFKNKNIYCKKNILNKSISALEYIDNFFSSLEKEIKNISFLDLPHQEVKFFIKKNLLTDFYYKTNSFGNKLKIINCFKYFFTYLFYVFYIFLHRSKKNINLNKKTFLLIDNMQSESEKLLFKDLKKTSYKNKYLIRATNKNILNNKNIVFFDKYKNYKISLKEFFYLFKILFVSIKISFTYKINFIYFSLKIIDTIFYYRSFFLKYKISNIIMHQHYLSNNIKNFYFKKNGGNKSCLIQKNIPSLTTINFFMHADILFTIGKNTQINNTFTKSKIYKSINIGSIFMNKNKKKINENINVKKNYDVICLGGNDLVPNGSCDTYETYNADYLNHLHWLVKLKKNNPKLKIAFKHHSNNKNSFESNILKKTGVLMLDNSLNSYVESLKSKFICSWASTMVVEMKALNFYSYFLDPNGKNDQFLHQLYNRKSLSITKFERFEQMVLKSLKEKKTDNTYCIDYKNVIFNIVANLEDKKL